MRLSTTTQKPDATLSPWAERLRQRVNVPLLVRWHGGRWTHPPYRCCRQAS